MAPLLIGYLLTLLLFLGLPWARRLNPALTTDEVRTRRTSNALGIVHAIALIVPVAATFVRVGPRSTESVAWLAVLVMSVAVTLQRWAQHSLGAYFTLALQSSSNQPVCRNGPYRWVRHPAYVAQIFFWTALGLSSRSMIAAALIGVMSIGAYSYRIREEERMLTAALGEHYKAYSSTTWRLIPGLW